LGDWLKPVLTGNRCNNVHGGTVERKKVELFRVVKQKGATKTIKERISELHEAMQGLQGLSEEIERKLLALREKERER